MIEEESIQPVTLERDSMVHEAVSRVVSNIMPVGSDTMTTLNDTTPGMLFLTLFILMDYPIHIDTNRMELSILYSKGLHFKISIK